MTSKQVTDRKKSTLAILSLLDDTSAKTLANAIHEFLSPYLSAGEIMPDHSLTLRLIWRALHQKITALENADQAHTAELANNGPLLEARDEKAETLYAALVKLREKLSGVFGAASLTVLGFSSATPEDPTALSSFAKTVASALRKPLPKPQDEDLTYNPTKSVNAIEKLQQELDLCLEKVAIDKRKDQKTQDDKNQAMAGNDDLFTRTTNFLVGAFQLVGMKALAKKVRPSTRRPGQLISESDDSEEG